MENEDDRPLPQTFWGPVEGADATPEPAWQPAPVLDFESWNESFHQFGMSAQEAYQKHYGQESLFIDPVGPLLTLDNIYQHLLVEKETRTRPATIRTQDAPDVEDQRKKEKALKAAQNAERAAAIAEANKKWREAIKMRKDALKAWDDYVSQTHAYFTQLKNAR